jgi:hypothetical protein
MSAYRVVERVVRNAALGIRFWDVATRAPVTDGLNVEVFARANPVARTVACVNRSGTYVAHRVSGLADFEHLDAEPEVLRAAALHSFRVEVRDPLGRFLPIAFDGDYPAWRRFTWRTGWLSPPRPIVLPYIPGSPPQLMLQWVPLFSAPTRPVQDALGVMRAELRLESSGRAAAWSLLEVRTDGDTRGLGLADREGRVAVHFAYPELPRLSLTSPPEPRGDFGWEAELIAYVPPAASPPRRTPESADMQAVFAALDAPQGVLLGGDSPAPPLRLGYREEQTLRTAGRGSYLWVSA